MMKFLKSGYLFGVIFAIAAVVWYTWGVMWAIGCGSTIALIIAFGSLIMPFVFAVLYVWECIRQ